MKANTVNRSLFTKNLTFLKDKKNLRFKNIRVNVRGMGNLMRYFLLLLTVKTLIGPS
jgi:hypothetical protein